MPRPGGIACILLSAASLYLGLSVANLRWTLCLVPVFLVLRMAMNALDGMLSREHGTATVAGEILNETLDVVGDTACYGVLLFVPDAPVLAATLLLVLIWMAEFFGVLGKGFPGGIRRHEAFLGGKPDRAIWISILALVLYFLPGFTAHIDLYLSAMCLFVLLTGLLRVGKILATAKGRNTNPTRGSADSLKNVLRWLALAGLILTSIAFLYAKHETGVLWLVAALVGLLSFFTCVSLVLLKRQAPMARELHTGP